jgi:hypothetical protein
LFDDWIRVLTIFGEPGQDRGDVVQQLEQLREQVAPVAAVNQPGKSASTS